MNLISKKIIQLQLMAFASFAQDDDGEVSLVAANPPEMKPLFSHDTPAFRAAKNFQHGVKFEDPKK